MTSRRFAFVQSIGLRQLKPWAPRHYTSVVVLLAVPVRRDSLIFNRPRLRFTRVNIKASPNQKHQRRCSTSRPRASDAMRFRALRFSRITWVDLEIHIHMLSEVGTGQDSVSRYRTLSV